jgi:hypothetical protein
MSAPAPLLGDVEEPSSALSNWRRDQARRARAERVEACTRVVCGPAGLGCGLCLFSTFVLVVLLGISTLRPTEMGFRMSGWTGKVDTETLYGPGMHWLGVRQSFVRFPSNQVSIEFSNHFERAQGPPVQTRTGAEDASDPDSGGQPVNISFAFQFSFDPSTLARVYEDFGQSYQDRYDLIARNAISTQSQLYRPEEFWANRTDVVDAGMRFNLTRAMWEQGYVRVQSMQMLRVDFPDSYEDQITAFQLKVQQKTTSQYEQQVKSIESEIQVLNAQNDAKIAQVNATATAAAAQIVNGAQAEGFQHVQATKATSYKALMTALGLEPAEMVEYLKLKAVNSRGDVVMGVKNEL